MKIVCLFVTWNSSKLLEGSIGNLRTILPNQAIIVVDNGSVDQSPDNIQRRWPEIELHRLPTNTGFAGGNNYGVKAALQRGYDAIFLLNVDTIIDENFIAPCVSILEKQPEVGIVGPVILEAFQDGVIQCAGGRIRSITLNFDFLDKGKKFIRRERLCDVGYVLGAAMLVRRTIFEQVGFFDEDYFPAYVEEADLCYRAKRAGYRSVVFHGCGIRHIGQQSSGGRLNAFNRWSKNKFYFAIKHSGSMAFLWGAMLVVFSVFYWKLRGRR
jgi:GT2 family glycosyltransferase